MARYSVLHSNKITIYIYVKSRIWLNVFVLLFLIKGRSLMSDWVKLTEREKVVKKEFFSN